MPMLELLLLRHAKSSWGVADIDDHERDLEPRGIRAAARIARYLADEELLPDLVLCSSSRRTRSTAALVFARFSQQPRVSVLPELYLATPERIAGCVRREGDGARRLMVIGHNPGLQSFALALAGEDGELRGQMAVKFPTAALARYRIDARDWQALRPGLAELKAFVVPRSLPGA